VIVALKIGVRAPIPVLGIENSLLFLRIVNILTGPYGATLTDWYRSPEQNARVGGVPDSLHTLGLAVDLRRDGAGAAAAQSWSESGLQVIAEPDHWHLELQPK